MFLIEIIVFKLVFAIIQLVFLIGVFSAFIRPFISLESERSNCDHNCEEFTIAVLLPFYKEHLVSVMRTAESIANQRYDPNLITVYILVEENDEITKRSVPRLVEFFRFMDIKVGVIYTKSGPLGKPDALNQALSRVKEDIVVIFDADDFVPSNYLSRVSLEIKNGAAAVTTKVYRIGTGLHSKFIALDTFIWYDIYLPVYIKLIGYVPMSGEGLAIKRTVLDKIGGFPKSLTEDAYLTLELAKIGEKIAYLYDCVYN